MTTTSGPPVDTTARRRCGCCGKDKPADRVTELGDSPGVYICTGCALWAARRASQLPVLRVDARRALRRLQRLCHRRDDDTYRMAIPVLPVTDLDTALPFYSQLGFETVERLDDFAVLQAGAIKIHLSQFGGHNTPVCAAIRVGDPARLWKKLTSQQATGLGPVEDHPWGIRDFTATDPDGNTLRFGHPTPDH